MADSKVKVFINTTNRFVKLAVPHPTVKDETFEVSVEIGNVVINSKMNSSQSDNLVKYLNTDDVKVALQVSLLEALSKVEIRDVASSNGNGGNNVIADLFGGDDDTI